MMRSNKGKERRALVVVLLSLALVLGFGGELRAGDKMLKAPEFSLKNMDGEVVALSQLLGKGPIVINFWATWCKPCVKELPHLDKIYKDYREKGVSVLAISEDSPWSVSKVKSFITGNRYTFTVLLDTNGEVMRRYGLLGTPYTLLLNAKGEILYKHFGYRPGDENSLRAKIEDALLGAGVEKIKGMTEEGNAGG